MFLGPHPDSRYFYYHYRCEKLGQEVMIEDWLIPYDQLENALPPDGTKVTCKHCGSLHALFISKPRGKTVVTRQRTTGAG